MQKLKISVDKGNQRFLNYIKKRVPDAIGTKIEGDHAFLIIEQPNLEEMQDIISEVIINDYKTAFLTKRLKLPIENNYNKHAFIKALTAFDRESDKILCTEKMQITEKTENFVIDSFFNFKLASLRRRWEEVCKLANENTSFLLCNETFAELLRFLIKNLECRIPEVHLFKHDKTYELLNSNLKPISNVYENSEFSDELSVLTKLISIAPKKIILHLNTKEKDDTINFICSIFENNVEILQN